MTGSKAVLEGLSGLQDQELAKRFNVEPAPRAVAQEYLSLYPNRVQGILRPPGCKSWVTVSKHFPITDETILSALAGEEKNLWGLRWGKQTKFAVLDIDKGSKYHQAAELQKLQAKLAAVGLRATPYRSSESGGWHLYSFLEDWTDSNDLKETLKKWLYGQGYEIRNGTLEIFPSGMGLRLPLQRGFGWLDDNAELIVDRKELTREEAISRFLLDLETRSSNWTEAKNRITAQLDAKQISQGVSVQAHEKAIDTDGFESLFNYRLIHEKYQDGRQYWQTGLTANGQRHDAILAIEHYFWHGDKAAGVPALPGEWNDEQRYRLILAWLKESHNGFCNHINRGNWRKVEAQIKRAVKWRRPSGAIQVREPYLMSERQIERLIALSKSTGRTWTPEDLKKGNDGREEGARKRIREAVQLLIDQGKRLTVLGLSRASGCSRTTVRRHLDIWKLSPTGPLSGCTGDQNPFLVLDSSLDLKGPGGTVPGVYGSGSKEEFLDPPGLEDSGNLGIEQPISATVAPLQFCPANSQPESTQYQARALRVASQALTPGPLLSGIRAEWQMCAGGISFIFQPGPVCYTDATASSIKERADAASVTGALGSFGAKNETEKIIPDATNYNFLTTVWRGYSSGLEDEFSLIINPRACSNGGMASAPVVGVASGLFVIPQTYRPTDKQTSVDVRRIRWLGEPFGVSLHQPTASAPEITSTCLQFWARVSRFPIVTQAPKVKAGRACKQLQSRHIRIFVYGDVRGPPSVNTSQRATFEIIAPSTVQSNRE